VREGLRLLKEHDEICAKWREQIERGWLPARRRKSRDGTYASGPDGETQGSAPLTVVAVLHGARDPENILKS